MAEFTANAGAPGQQQVWYEGWGERYKNPESKLDSEPRDGVRLLPPGLQVYSQRVQLQGSSCPSLAACLFQAKTNVARSGRHQNVFSEFTPLLRRIHRHGNGANARGGATDDPEGAIVLQEVMDTAGDDSDIIILNLSPWSALEINALQRASDIIIQKSLKEGFGLTVTEALWKRQSCIASAVGGIPVQVIHKLTGVLVRSVEGCAYQIRYLLTHPGYAKQLGSYGYEHVKENFLMTSNLRRWLLLFQIMLGTARPAPPEPATGIG